MRIETSFVCVIAYIPKPIRLIMAWGSIVMGAALMVTPIPGGIVLLGAGILLLYCSSVTMRSRIYKKLLSMPRLHARIKPYLQNCDACSAVKNPGMCSCLNHSVKKRGTK